MRIQDLRPDVVSAVANVVKPDRLRDAAAPAAAGVPGVDAGRLADALIDAALDNSRRASADRGGVVFITLDSRCSPG